MKWHWTGYLGLKNIHRICEHCHIFVILFPGISWLLGHVAVTYLLCLSVIKAFVTISCYSYQYRVKCNIGIPLLWIYQRCCCCLLIDSFVNCEPFWKLLDSLKICEVTFVNDSLSNDIIYFFAHEKISFRFRAAHLLVLEYDYCSVICVSKLFIFDWSLFASTINSLSCTGPVTNVMALLDDMSVQAWQWG